MWWQIIILSLISGILYRLGGIGDPFNTKVRDFGCPTIALITLIWTLDIYAPWWIHFISFGLMFGAMTKYWDYWGSDDVEWYEWALTGFMYGLSFIAYPIDSHHWLGFGLRTGFLTIFMPLWKKYCPKKKIFHDKADIDEIGVGIAYNSSLLFFLL
jgi:hypothetical protein